MTTIKNTLIGLTVLALLASCGNDDDGAGYNFKNQDLAGKIGGSAFVAGEGTVEFGYDDEEQMFITIYHDSEETAACEMDEAAHDYLMFVVPEEEGVYELFLNLSEMEGQVVTLYDLSEEENNIATLGAIEITEITETEVTGKIDARMNSDNSVNGNFTVAVCPGL